MNVTIKIAFFFSLCLLIFSAGSGFSKSYSPLFPDALIAKLGIDAEDIIKNQNKFRNDPIHTEWMIHVHSAIPDIDPEKHQAIIKTHTSLLFIKDRLDNAFFSNKMNKQKYTTRLTGLMQWFQETNRSVLNEEEYNALFGISGQKKPPASAFSSDGKLGFPINNPSTTVEMIKKKFDDRTIADITRFYQQHSQELDDIRQMYEARGIPDVETDPIRPEVKPEQIKMDMLRIEKELTTTFRDYCQDRLSEEQFEMLFVSPKDQ